jgi:enoyl-CoA hydratase/carnithine racemase
LQELLRIVERLEASNEVKTVIFTGTGNVFASGADLREISRVRPDNAVEYALRGQTLMTRISKLEQSTIAFVNGFCFGGALDLALSCKRRIATKDAEFCHPGAGLGIITGWGGTQRLPRLIGESRTLEMLFTARRVGAREALEIGLIDEIVESVHDLTNGGYHEA